MEASDVKNVVTFNRERICLVCLINLGLLHASRLGFKRHFNALLACDESEGIYQDGLAIVSSVPHFRA